MFATNQITATAEAQMEQSAEQDDGRAIASMVGCFKNTCGMLSWYPNVSQFFSWSFRWNVLCRFSGKDLVVPCRMSPVKRAEVHPSRLGCPSLFFSFRIPELAKDPWFCRCILNICRFCRCLLPIQDAGIWFLRRPITTLLRINWTSSDLRLVLSSFWNVSPACARLSL